MVSIRSFVVALFIIFIGSLAPSAYSEVPIRIETVDSSVGSSGAPTSIAVTPDGKVCIAYVEHETILRYAERDQNCWSSEIIRSNGGDYSKVSLSLDPEGNPVVAVERVQTLFVHAKSGGQWDTIYMSDEASWDPTIRHDVYGNIHLSCLQWRSIEMSSSP